MKELREHNDYVNTTKDWLKRYNQFKATIENFKDDIITLENMLSLNESAPIAKYDDEPAGGTSDLNAVESAASRRLEIEHRIDERKHDIANIEVIIRKVDRALSVMTDEDRALIVGHYFDYKTWTQLGHELYLSERWARSKCNAAIKKAAGILFGSKVSQDSLFVFMEC